MAEHDDENVATLAPTARPEPERPAETTYDFDALFQEKVAALALRDTTFLARTNGLIKPAYFENQADAFIADMGTDFFRRYKKAPTDRMIYEVVKDAIAAKKIHKDLKDEVVLKLRRILKTDLSDRDYVVEKVSRFAKHRAIEEAMTKSIGHWQKGDYETVRDLMSSSFLVGEAPASSSYDYWAEIGNRTQERHDIVSGKIKPDGITTGYNEFDACLLPHLGWGRKELSLMMGAAKAGKSMSLGDFGKNASLAGHNVIYFSNEVSAKIIASRTDANVSRLAMKVLNKSADDVDRAVRAASIGAGKFFIEEFPSGTLTPSMVRRVLEYYRALGVVFDLIISDYADIMAPDLRAESAIENFRQIYLDCRAIAFEYNAAFLTATQTNREGAKAATAKMTDVAEDFNKVRTADTMISINSTDDEKASGEARLFFAAMRNAESGFSLRIQQDRSAMRFISKVLGRE